MNNEKKKKTSSKAFCKQVLKARYCSLSKFMNAVDLCLSRYEIIGEVVFYVIALYYSILTSGTVLTWWIGHGRGSLNVWDLFKTIQRYKYFMEIGRAQNSPECVHRRGNPLLEALCWWVCLLYPRACWLFISFSYSVTCQFAKWE